jgi:hypothetical protein
MLLRVLLLALVSIAALPSASSAQALRHPDSIYLFGGIYTREVMGRSLVPFLPSYDDVYMVGGAYQRQFFELGFGFLIGGEVGVAGRFGDTTSGEVWGGMSIRSPGIPIGAVILTPGIVIGLSAVSDTVGFEREREISRNGDATLLGYFSPELAFTFPQWPQFAIVYRLHHRSGLFGTFGGMGEGHNAQTLGLRWSFGP